MRIEMDRRHLVKVSAASGLALALGGKAVFAQDATPGQTTPEDAPVYSVEPGSEEGELVVTHAQGETQVSVSAEMVVSYDIASVDTLQTLGVAIAGLPEITGGDGVIETEGTENVGSLFEPDYEKVNEMSPDLIIVAGRSAEVYPDLSDLAPTIDLSFQTGDFVAGLEANSRILGAIFEKDAEVEEQLAAISTRVADIKEMASGITSGMVIMTSGGSVTALAPGTARAGRGALIYQTLGITPPVEDLETATHGEPISFEFLLEHDPEWLFVIDRDAATSAEDGQPAEQVLDNDIIHQTTAWTEGNIVYLNPFDWYVIVGAGLSSMNRMLDELETAFSK
jgi:iron complex transport system substrate-binding protein